MDMVELQRVMEASLNEYNMMSKSSMSLVLFEYMVQHVARVSRVLKQHAGHALLIGFGGSGRQSSAKLAAYMANYDLYQVNILIKHIFFFILKVFAHFHSY